jgi:CBS domain-containing protein
MVTVREVMRPRVVTVVPQMTVRELAHTFLEERVRGAIVIGPSGKVVGVVTETDVLRALLGAPRDAGGQPEACDPDRRRVGDIMGPPGLVVAPGETLRRLAQAFACDGVQRAVVMDDGMLLGIVTPADLMGTVGP